MENVPNHIGIIMDGNGRWATNLGKNRSEGHKEGAKTLRKLVLYANNIGIKVLSVYAFSTDNFKRSEEEVNYLMDLFILCFEKHMDEAVKNGVKIVFSGRKEPLSKKVLDAMSKIMEKSKDNTKMILNVCLNYGAQEELVDATLRIYDDLNNGILKREDLNRDNYLRYMYQDLPPIDLLIRTGGEHRLSNFMLYQSYYSEIYFSDIYFPDFKEDELDKSINYFVNRDRRFGSIDYKKLEVEKCQKED